LPIATQATAAERVTWREYNKSWDIQYLLYSRRLEREDTVITGSNVLSRCNSATAARTEYNGGIVVELSLRSVAEKIALLTTPPGRS